MRTSPATSSVAALLVTLALTGCDLFGSTDHTVRASGRVVDAETGAPLAGIFVTIYEQSLIIVPRDEAYTDADGRFTLEHDDGPRPERFVVRVNSDPAYDDRYSTARRTVSRGSTVDFGDIALVPTGRLAALP